MVFDGSEAVGRGVVVRHFHIACAIRGVPVIKVGGVVDFAARGEQGAVRVAAAVRLVIGADGGGEVFAGAAGAVAEEADGFAGEVVAVVEQGGEAGVERSGVAVAGIAAVSQARGEGSVFGAGVVDAGEVGVRLDAHFVEGQVVAIGGVGVVGQATFGAVVLPGVFQRLEVGKGGVFAVHQRGFAVVRPPEVHDVFAVQAAFRGDGGEARLGADEHGDGSSALGRLGGAVQVVSGDVGGEDEDFARRLAGDKGAGELQGGGGAVAGLFEFDGAAVGGEVEQAVHADGGGFGLVHAAFGGEEDSVNAVRAAVTQDGGSSVCGHADDVFVVRGDAHPLLTDAEAVFVRVNMMLGGEGGELKVVVRGVKTELVDADVHMGMARVMFFSGILVGKPAGARQRADYSMGVFFTL